MIYQYLMNGNLKYNSTEVDIFKSNFNCDPEQVSETVVIAPTWDSSIFAPYADQVEKISVSGRGFSVSEIKLGKNNFTYINVGIGACNMLDAVMALSCTNCREIIFIGSVGALDESINIGDIVIPQYSMCGVGANRYLSLGSISGNDCFGKKYYPDTRCYTKMSSIIKNLIKSTDVKKHIGRTYSVDTIFAQYAHLDEIMSFGCNSIEMETATLFHAAHISGLNAVAVFVVSDNAVISKSLYSGRNNEDIDRKNRSKKQLVPNAVINYLTSIN